jgi:hypothetical protein
MMRRLFWFLLGAIAGVVGVSWAKRKVVDFSEQVTLASVVSALVRGAQTAVASLIGYTQGFFSTKESTDFDADTYSGI